MKTVKKHFPRIFRGLLLVSMALVWQGCRSAGPDSQTTPLAEGPIVAAPEPRHKAGVFDESALVVSELAPDRVDERELAAFEMPRRPQEDEAGEVSSAAGGFPAALMKAVDEPDQMLRVQLNLDAAPMTEVVPLFSTLLGFDYILNPAVAGAVTMKLDSEMSARQVWSMFEHILSLSGAYASPRPGLVQILPNQEMSRENRLFAEDEPAPNVRVALLRVKNMPSTEMLKILNPFMTSGATVVDLQGANALLVVDTPPNVSKLRELLEALDIRGEASWPRRVFNCRQVDAQSVVQELQTILPILGLPVTASSPSGGQIKLTAVPRLQVIVASAALPDVLDEVGRWVEILDRQNETEQENIYFYNVRHGRARQLAEALGVFFGNVSASTVESQSQGTESMAISGKAVASGKPSPPTRPSAAGTRGPKGESSGIFDTPLVIYADGYQNRLTMRTTRRAYALVETLLKRLDTPPRQVLIQAVVADITLTESTEYGFSYAAMQQYGDYAFKHAMIGAPAAEATNFPDPKTFPDGIAFLLKKDDDKMAFVRAVAGESNVRVLSAPQIMATNDKEAMINVGDRVPIITGDYTDVADEEGTIRRSIDYADTGVILTVTPYITAGNEVTLEILQEVSDAVKTESSGIDSPTIRNRQLSTTMVVPDGRTALLGGLIRTQETKKHDGVPLLMDIPWLGMFFRKTSNDNDRTEIIVLITVQVVESHTPVEQLAKRYEA